MHMDDSEPEDGIQSFCQVSNVLGCPKRSAQVDASLSHINLPSQELITAIAQRLSKNLGLRLFNFDLISEEGSSKQLYIVDINYFPGYGKMPRYEHVLSDFFVSLKREKTGRAVHEAVPSLLVDRMVCF